MPNEPDYLCCNTRQIPDNRGGIKRKHNEIFNNSFWIQLEQNSVRWNPARLIDAILAFFALAAFIALPAASGSLSLTAPPEMDVSGEESCEIIFSPDSDSNKLSACLTVPEGFSGRGDAEIRLASGQSSCKSSHNGNTIQWDLSGPIKSCRHVVINEMDQNPSGTDSKKEWIELFNPSGQRVDIGGWLLANSHSDKTVIIPEGTAIQPGGYQLINWTKGTLINSVPISISLLDASGHEIDRTIAAKDSKNNKLCWARE